jgi:hypothetical protein
MMHSFPASFQFSWPVTSCPSWNNPEAPGCKPQLPISGLIDPDRLPSTPRWAVGQPNRSTKEPSIEQFKLHTVPYINGTPCGIRRRKQKPHGNAANRVEEPSNSKNKNSLLPKQLICGTTECRGTARLRTQKYCPFRGQPEA